MNILILITFTAISFIIYGYSSLVSKRMKLEYLRWGFSKHRKIIGYLQFLGGIGLIVGIKINSLLILVSICFILMMSVAILVRIKIKDNIAEILPAITYLSLNILILYSSLNPDII